MGFLHTTSEYVVDLVSLLFPNLCQSCEQPLAKGEDVICLMCQYELPETKFYLEKDNVIEKLFWGRVQIEHAASFYYFDSKTKIQHLLHQLKYHGKKEVANKVGALFGTQLIKAKYFKGINMIIPVPLHRRRMKERGYNQSDHFAEGLSESMNIPWSNKILLRKQYTSTQTGKTRFERWNNVMSAFMVINKGLPNDSHVLLVDDVVTTGATLEACAKTLLEIEGLKVSIATIAVAH